MNEEKKQRVVVIPGDEIGASGLKSGSGTYRRDGKVFAAQLGIRNVRGDFVNVIPLGGRYIPRSGDSVIGVVVEMGPSNWLVDINSPYPAPMHVSEVPWKVEFGDTARYLTIGDAILAKVLAVDEIKHVQVTMKEHGLRKLAGGQLVEISHSKVPRMIGKGGSMIALLKDATKCRIFVGQNGRVWLDGEQDNMMKATQAIKRIDEASQHFGLTEEIKKMLNFSGAVTPQGDKDGE
ncbi:MAG: RNA-binding protein [Euryarchaeota archaeon]|nr:RNA-binding protein [Euryarchaeota archaeon]